MKLEQMLSMEEQYLKLFYLPPCLDASFNYATLFLK
jgi:hypothetical protein